MSPTVQALVYASVIERFVRYSERYEGRVALAEDPSILRGWLSLAYRRGLADGMAERDELRAAAQALVADLESDEGHWPGWCDHPRCRRLFTLTDGKGCTCDEHQGDLIAERLQDCSYTPALRRLMGTKKEGA